MAACRPEAGVCGRFSGWDILLFFYCLRMLSLLLPCSHAHLRHGTCTALAALCSAGTLAQHGWAGTSAMLEGGEHIGTAGKGFPGRGRRAHAASEQDSRGAYRCFVVHGKAKCVQARSNLLAKRKIIEMGKEKVPTTIITPQRLDEIKAEISANTAAADKLLADEGWAGVEKSQREMAARIADKVRSLSRMVGTLRASHDGIVQELIAKAAAPGPPVCCVKCTCV